MNIAVTPVRSSTDCGIAIIGAGPYGLAMAAHLRAVGASIRVFGDTMSFWRRNMPKDMKLRSPWVATHIADPLDRYLLDDYFREVGLPRPDLLPAEKFIDYGKWFQERVVPDLDTRAVVKVAAVDGGFRFVLEDGENFFAKRVVMATACSIMSTDRRNSTACRASWPVIPANIWKPDNSADVMLRSSAADRAHASGLLFCVRRARMSRSFVKEGFCGMATRISAAC